MRFNKTCSIKFSEISSVSTVSTSERRKQGEWRFILALCLCTQAGLALGNSVIACGESVESKNVSFDVKSFWDSMLARMPDDAGIAAQLHVLRVESAMNRSGDGLSDRSQRILDRICGRGFAPCAFAVPGGARFLPPGQYEKSTMSAQAHHDQVLSQLGEIGVPLSLSVATDVAIMQLSDILADSVSHFTLKADDIEWSVIAYCCYVSPPRIIRNRFGEVYSFDAIADELLARRVSQGACGGSHLLVAMLKLIEKDDRTTVLKDDTRRRLLARISEISSKLERFQVSDGSWDIDCLSETVDQHSLTSFSPDKQRLVVTSHILEAVLANEKLLNISRARVQSARNWLCVQLQKRDSCRHDDNEFCPVCHAIASVILCDRKFRMAIHAADN